MKILQVIHQFLPRHQAGSELYTHALSKALIGRKHEVRVFTYEYGSSPDGSFLERSTYNTVPVYRAYPRPPTIPRLYWVRAALDSFRNEAIGSQFADVLREFRPDVVHVQHLHNVSATVVRHARQMRIPVVMTLHDFWMMCPRINLFDYQKKICMNSYGGSRCGRCLELSRQIGKAPELSSFLAPLFIYRRQYLKSVIREIDYFISPSEFLRNRFIEFGVPPRKIVTSDNGYDVSRFSGYQKSGSRQFRVGYIGSLMEHKGVHLLIEAFRRLAGDSILKVFGDPASQPLYSASLRQMAEGDSRIRFCGRFENKNIAGILSEIDVLVIPSLWYENSPLTIHEAFLAKIPVVTAGLGGMAEYVQDGVNGIHFNYGSSEDLYVKLAALEGDRSFLDALNKFPKVKTIEENASDLERIYETLKRSV